MLRHSAYRQLMFSAGFGAFMACLGPAYAQQIVPRPTSSFAPPKQLQVTANQQTAQLQQPVAPSAKESPTAFPNQLVNQGPSNAGTPPGTAMTNSSRPYLVPAAFVSHELPTPQSSSKGGLANDASPASATVRSDAQFAIPVNTQMEFQPVHGTQDRSGFSVCNPATQPQVALGRCQPNTVAVDCADDCGRAQTWKDLHPYPFQPLAHGEYLGPIRLPATLDYRVRVGDQLRFLFIDSPTGSLESYRLMIGDEIQIESTTDAAIRRGDLVLGKGLTIQPDGKITVSLLGQVHAAGLTIPQLRHNLEVAYKAYIREPSIDVTPIRTNSLKTSILNSVDARQGVGGQNYIELVHTDGTIRLPKIGSISVQGMTLDEIKREINLRFGQIVAGLEIEPIINAEAPHFVFVTGEVTTPGRFQLLGPTSVSQALALAGGWRDGGNMREIVIFRRAEDWRLIATRIDLRGAALGKVPTPADEIWLRDSDLVIVPKTPIRIFNSFVRQVFTDGVYGIVPFGGYSISEFRGDGGVN